MVFVAHTGEEARSLAREKFGRDVELTRERGRVDTWFSSALWPFSTIGWPTGRRNSRNTTPATCW